MKLFTFIAEHSINWPLIWSDCSIYVCIWLFVCLILTIVIASNYGHSVRKEAEENADSVVQSLSHELDMLELQNCYLRQSFTDHKKEIERLSKLERKRDEKGHFVTQSGKGHGKRKDWTKATKEELIKEAKRRYPIGTKVECVKYKDDKLIITSHDHNANLDDDLEIWFDSNKIGMCVYSNGKWAKIIKS